MAFLDAVLLNDLWSRLLSERDFSCSAVSTSCLLPSMQSRYQQQASGSSSVTLEMLNSWHRLSVSASHWRTKAASQAALLQSGVSCMIREFI